MDEKTTPKKTRRVGTLTFALVLILAGVLLMIYQLVPGFDLLWILRFSPAILIVLGIELLFYSSKPDAKVRFDWLSMLGCAFILCIVGTAAVLPTVWNLRGPGAEIPHCQCECECLDQPYGKRQLRAAGRR